MPRGFFLFRFSSAQDKELITTNGPWSFRGQVLKLFSWYPELFPLTAEIKSAPVWIRLLGLPIIYWSRSALNAIAGKFGELIQIDELTLQKNRGRYARICVDMDISKPLLQGIWISRDDNKFFQPVQYESVPSVCFSCGRVLHRTENCPFKASSSASVPNPGQPVFPQHPATRSNENVISEEFLNGKTVCGPWIMVGKQGRRRPSAGNNLSTSPSTNSARNTHSNGRVDRSTSPSQRRKSPPLTGQRAHTQNIANLGHVQSHVISQRAGAQPAGKSYSQHTATGNPSGPRSNELLKVLTKL